MSKRGDDEGMFTWNKSTDGRPYLYWWGGVANFFRHVTAFNLSDDSIDQSNCRTIVTCQNKFTTPPYQHGRLFIIP